MPQPNIYYRERLQTFLDKNKAVKTRLIRISLLRLLIFFMMAFLVYLYHDTLLQVTAILLPGAAVFLLLVNRTAKHRYLRDKYQQLIRINQTELDALGGNFSDLETGSDLQNRDHAFSHDIDLFGNGSFFQYLNRTSTTMGRSRLAEELTANYTENIPGKQEAVHELSQLPDWRQEFSANAAMIKTETPEEDILKWIENYRPTLPRRLKWLPPVWTLLSVAIFILTVLELSAPGIFITWFIAGLLISGLFFSKVSRLSVLISQSQDTFRQYRILLNAIESHAFKSTLLEDHKSEGNSPGETASQALHTLTRRIDALDQRNNLLVAILINPLGLADLYNGLRIEEWILQHREQVRLWFSKVAYFDAAISKGNFHFNHPGYSFPEIVTRGGVIRATNLGHPLIPAEKLVRNTVTTTPGEFMVITGANMAGKSTFLRTTALFIVMSNCGLPVCATEATYRPIKLITSMRTVDSLNEEASYFYAELKRLRFIIDQLEQDEYFIILDEILKGTNSKDKAIGSRKFVERLADSGSSGIIATHDLSLCEVAENIESVKNYFFDASIEKGELYFDYKLREGICTNMNASFLLGQMGIV